MIEMKEKGFVYVTVNEKQLTDKLFRIKPESAIYYKNGKKIGYHWNLSSNTIGKLNLRFK